MLFCDQEAWLFLNHFHRSTGMRSAYPPNTWPASKSIRGQPSPFNRLIQGSTDLCKAWTNIFYSYSLEGKGLHRSDSHITG